MAKLSSGRDYPLSPTPIPVTPLGVARAQRSVINKTADPSLTGSRAAGGKAAVNRTSIDAQSI